MSTPDYELSKDLTVDRFQRDQQRKHIRDRRRKFVQRSIERCYELLGYGEVDRVAEVAAALAAEFDADSVSVGDLPEIVSGGHVVHLFELSTFLTALERGDSGPVALRAAASDDPLATVAGRIVDSLVAVAADESYLPDGLQDTQPVLGYEMQLGERYVRADSQATGTLELRDPDGELKSILCAGGKGSGKSTAVETLTIDSYAHGHKIVDLVDFFKGENTLYDVPQQDNGEGLIDAREEMGVPTGFDDLEAGFAWLDGDPDPDLLPSPELEILIPMCPGLEEMRIPAVGEHYTVRPFTIPASELTYRQLVMLLHHTTEARENELRSAHQALRETGKDWTLADVADYVRLNGNSTDQVADAIETSLKTTQEKGFIRDRSCEYTLDWADVMADQRIVTAFTVHPMKETADHLVVLSYLIDSLFEARKGLVTNQRLPEFPPLSVVMREMHKVAPRSTGESSAESTVEKYMIDSLEDVFALTRHANMEVLGDTQKFYRQLAPEVSGLFDHILAFRGQIPDVKHIFKTRVDNTRPAEWVAQYKEPGKCAFVSERGYRLPIKMAPPRCHHLEAKSDGSGLGFRARILDGERLVESPWGTDEPERLSFSNVSKGPIDRFFDRYVRIVDDRKEWVKMCHLHEAYCEWAEIEGEEQFEQGRVTRRLREYFDEVGDNTYYQRREGDERFSCHRRVVLLW